MNPQSGWLGWWRSADGQLHDYASPVVNGLAIEYGLISPADGRVILAKLRAKMADVKFTRFDLGIPPMLIPVRREDYLTGIGGTCGEPRAADGADTFGQYMNGGISPGQSLHFLAAHYVVGDPEPADRILRAMLPRAKSGDWQNGIRARFPDGADWQTWDGKPSGADGYLADNFRCLQAVLLREKSFRDRLIAVESGAMIHRSIGADALGLRRSMCFTRKDGLSGHCLRQPLDDPQRVKLAHPRSEDRAPQIPRSRNPAATISPALDPCNRCECRPDQKTPADIRRSRRRWGR
jgi:hypothetical protein